MWLEVLGICCLRATSIATVDQEAVRPWKKRCGSYHRLRTSSHVRFQNAHPCKFWRLGIVFVTFYVVSSGVKELVEVETIQEQW